MVGINKRWMMILVVLLSFIPIVSAPVWYGSGDDTGLILRISCEGNFKDSSGSGNHGTQGGGVKITSGVKGRACSFDGSDDMVTANDNDSLTSMNNLTISAWFKSDSLGSWRAIIGKGTSDANEEYTLMVISTGVYFDVGGSGPYSNTAYTITSGNWHHIAAVHSRNATASTLKVYVDNVDIGATTTGPTLTPGNNSLNLSIGSRFYTGLSYFSGFIDELRVYNRALSATEISALYNTTKTYKIQLYTTPTKGGLNETPAPTASDETGLVGYWKMDDLTNGKTTDSSGQGNNGTVTGAIFTNEGRWNGAFVNDGATSPNTNYIVPTQNGITNILNVSTQPFTVSAWWKPRVFTASALIVARVGWNSGLLSDTDGFKCMLVNTSGASITLNGGSCSGLNTWCFGTCTYNGTHFNAYHNGVLTHGPTEWTAGNIYALAPITIGGYTTWGSNGTIDEVRIYNRSLSADEVKELYLSKGLVGYWKMDADQKNSTSTFDSSGYYNHGLISGATLTNEGRFKEGYKFDGVNDYINVSDTVSLNPTSITITAWVKPSTTTYGTIIMKYNSSNKGYGYYAGGGSSGVEQRFFVDGVSADANNFLTVNQWNHIAVAYNTTHVFFYLNGVSDGTSALAGGTIDSTTNVLRIGADTGVTPIQEFLNGSIDEVRIYNRALTAEEVAGLYNGTKSNHIELWTTPVQGGLNDTPAPTSSNEAGLVGYWKLDGDATDSSGQGNNGVVTGANATNAGRWNGAYYFYGPGSSNMINMSNNRPSLNISTGNFSGFAWIKFVNNADGYQTIMGKLPVGGSGWMFMTYNVTVNNSLKLYYSVSDGTATAGYSTGSIADNSWHHVGFTTDRSSVSTFYIDGASSGTLNTAARTGSLENTADFKIGLYAGYDPTGTIDEVRLYNRTLSADEVKELYLSKGLVGYWKMDADQKNSTSTFDSSGYYNHGLISGAALTNEGRFKEAYKFDGSNDYVNIPFSPALNVSQNPTQYTLGAWIRFSGKEGYDGIVSPRAVAVDSFGMTRETGRNDINCFTYNSTATAFNTFTTTTFADNVWYYVVCTNNGSVVKAYTNGVYEASTTFSGGVKTQSTNGWVIGRYYSDSNDHYFNGTIDEVRIYNRALSDSEVGQLYNGTKTNRIQLFSIPG